MCAHNRNDSACGREFDGIREQVPEELVQPRGIAQNQSGLLIERGAQQDALGRDGRLERLAGLPDDRRQIDRAVPHVVQQPPRRGHENIRPLAKTAHLGLHVGAADNEQRAHLQTMEFAFLWRQLGNDSQT